MICDVPSIQVQCADADTDVCKIAIADGSAGLIMVNTLLLSCLSQAITQDQIVFALILCVACSYGHISLCFLDPASHIFSIVKKKGFGPVLVRGKRYLA